MMDKFEFLIGTWNLDYHIPKSSVSEADTGTGRGQFKRALDNKVVIFDYECEVGGQKGQAHGIFRWDEKTQIYHYSWFESSGAFMAASCQFLNDSTLFLNWHNSVLRQTFKKIDENEIILHMGQPNHEGEFELILEVVLKRER